MTERVRRKCSRTKLVWALGVLLGCQEAPEHPPTIDTCPPGELCPPGSVAQQDPNDSQGDGPGSGGAAPDVIEGSVRELVDDLFQSSIAFTGDATIAAEGARRAIVEATYGGVGQFQLQDFKPADPLWLAVYPEENRGVLPTLAPIPLRGAFDEVDLGVVREDNLEVVFQLASTSPERLTSAAQLVLLFTDDTDARLGMDGVEVSMADAEFISYANAGSWSDLDVATDRTGLVVLANIDAPEFPGATRRVYLGGRATGSISVRMAAGAVSLVEVPIH